MTLFIIFRIIGYSIIIYDIILLFFSVIQKKKNAIYVPGYIKFYALFFFLCFTVIFIMSFNYQRSNNYDIGNWIGGIAYLLFTGGVGTILLMFLANWRLLILEDCFEYFNIFGQKKMVMFQDIDKEKSFYRVIKNPHIHLETQNCKIFIQNWFIKGNLELLYKTLKEIGIKKLEQ